MLYLYRGYSALAVKNIQASLIFLARFCVSLQQKWLIILRYENKSFTLLSVLLVCGAGVCSCKMESGIPGGYHYAGFAY